MLHPYTRASSLASPSNSTQSSNSSHINEFRHIYLSEASRLGLQPNQDVLRLIKDAVTHNRPFDRVDLRQMALDDWDVKPLVAALRKNRSVKTLILSHNYITDLTIFENLLDENNCIESLDLAYNLFSEDSARDFAQFMKSKPNVTCYNLKNTTRRLPQQSNNSSMSINLRASMPSKPSGDSFFSDTASINSSSSKKGLMRQSTSYVRRPLGTSPQKPQSPLRSGFIRTKNGSKSKNKENSENRSPSGMNSTKGDSHMKESRRLCFSPITKENNPKEIKFLMSRMEWILQLEELFSGLVVEFNENVFPKERILRSIKEGQQKFKMIEEEAYELVHLDKGYTVDQILKAIETSDHLVLRYDDLIEIVTTIGKSQSILIERPLMPKEPIAKRRGLEERSLQDFALTSSSVYVPERKLSTVTPKTFDRSADFVEYSFSVDRADAFRAPRESPKVTVQPINFNLNFKNSKMYNSEGTSMQFGMPDEKLPSSIHRNNSDSLQSADFGTMKTVSAVNPVAHDLSPHRLDTIEKALSKRHDVSYEDLSFEARRREIFETTLREDLDRMMGNTPPKTAKFHREISTQCDEGILREKDLNSSQSTRELATRVLEDPRYNVHSSKGFKRQSTHDKDKAVSTERGVQCREQDLKADMTSNMEKTLKRRHSAERVTFSNLNRNPGLKPDFWREELTEKQDHLQKSYLPNKRFKQGDVENLESLVNVADASTSDLNTGDLIEKAYIMENSISIMKEDCCMRQESRSYQDGIPSDIKYEDHEGKVSRRFYKVNYKDKLSAMEEDDDEEDHGIYDNPGGFIFDQEDEVSKGYLYIEEVEMTNIEDDEPIIADSLEEQRPDILDLLDKQDEEDMASENILFDAEAELERLDIEREDELLRDIENYRDVHELKNLEDLPDMASEEDDKSSVPHQSSGVRNFSDLPDISDDSLEPTNSDNDWEARFLAEENHRNSTGPEIGQLYNIDDSLNRADLGNLSEEAVEDQLFKDNDEDDISHIVKRDSEHDIEQHLEGNNEEIRMPQNPAPGAEWYNRAQEDMCEREQRPYEENFGDQNDQEEEYGLSTEIRKSYGDRRMSYGAHSADEEYNYTRGQTDAEQRRHTAHEINTSEYPTDEHYALYEYGLSQMKNIVPEQSLEFEQSPLQPIYEDADGLEDANDDEDEQDVVSFRNRRRGSTQEEKMMRDLLNIGQAEGSMPNLEADLSSSAYTKSRGDVESSIELTKLARFGSSFDKLQEDDKEQRNSFRPTNLKVFENLLEEIKRAVEKGYAGADQVEALNTIPQLQIFCYESLPVVSFQYDSHEESLIPSHSNRYFKHLLDHIQVIKLSHVKDLNTLWDFNWHQNIRMINLSNNGLTSIDFISSLRNLEFLNLNANNLKTLPNLTCAPTLKELYLSQNQFVHIPTFSLFAQLTIVDISFNRIDSFEALASFSLNQKLQILHLEGNPITQRSHYISTLKNILPHVPGLDIFHIDLSKFKTFENVCFSPVPTPKQQSEKSKRSPKKTFITPGASPNQSALIESKSKKSIKSVKKDLRTSVETKTSLNDSHLDKVISVSEIISVHQQSPQTSPKHSAASVQDKLLMKSGQKSGNYTSSSRAVSRTDTESKKNMSMSERSNSLYKGSSRTSAGGIKVLHYDLSKKSRGSKMTLETSRLSISNTSIHRQDSVKTLPSQRSLTESGSYIKKHHEKENYSSKNTNQAKTGKQSGAKDVPKYFKYKFDESLKTLSDNSQSMIYNSK